ncbi:MAG: hypothetical protein CVU09_04030 [Bacteroidetes bacterium HGW-Bacteroidetes-4]|jgi:hypothetical protein|nr:MAG: hypothetical protein CVU09_04030 [Bacteroidetes bacterium HGW-Bacteroidetes-4]
MITEKQRRNLLIKRIFRIPLDKFDELDAFVSKLENESGTKTRTLDYAGAWANIDDDIFNDLTENLIQKRQKNRSRIHE